MQSKLNYYFDHKLQFNNRFQIYENLGKKHSDRYQYVLPTYDFTKNLNLNNLKGSAFFILLEAII